MVQVLAILFLVFLSSNVFFRTKIIFKFFFYETKKKIGCEHRIKTLKWHRDTEHNDIQHNDTQNNIKVRLSAL
jgi:hypothetical protein